MVPAPKTCHSHLTKIKIVSTSVVVQRGRWGCSFLTQNQRKEPVEVLQSRTIVEHSQGAWGSVSNLSNLPQELTGHITEPSWTEPKSVKSQASAFTILPLRQLYPGSLRGPNSTLGYVLASLTYSKPELWAELSPHQARFMDWKCHILRFLFSEEKKKKLETSWAK